MATVDGTTIYAVHNQLVKKPDWIPVLARIAKQITGGDFPQEYLDSIFQSTADFPDIYVAYCFSMIDAWIHTGKVLTARIEVGYEPLPDKEIEANNTILQALPWPFHSEFLGALSMQDRDDGYLGWTEPVEFGQVIYTGEEVIETKSPRGIALEVGTTKADRTFSHILEGGVARWPYGSSSIFLFVLCHGFIDEIASRRDQKRISGEPQYFPMCDVCGQTKADVQKRHRSFLCEKCWNVGSRNLKRVFT